MMNLLSNERAARIRGFLAKRRFLLKILLALFLSFAGLAAVLLVIHSWPAFSREDGGLIAKISIVSGCYVLLLWAGFAFYRLNRKLVKRISGEERDSRKPIVFKDSHREFTKRLRFNLGVFRRFLTSLKEKANEKGLAAVGVACVDDSRTWCDELLSFTDYHLFQCFVAALEHDTREEMSQSDVDDIIKKQDFTGDQKRFIRFIKDCQKGGLRSEDEIRDKDSVKDICDYFNAIKGYVIDRKPTLYSQAKEAAQSEQSRQKIAEEQNRIGEFCKEYDKKQRRAIIAAIVYAIVAIAVLGLLAWTVCFFYRESGNQVQNASVDWSKITLRIFILGSTLTVMFWCLRMYKTMLNMAAQYAYRSATLRTYPYFQGELSGPTQDKITLRVLDAVCSPLTTGLVNDRSGGESETNNIINLGDALAGAVVQGLIKQSH